MHSEVAATLLPEAREDTRVREDGGESDSESESEREEDGGAGDERGDPEAARNFLDMLLGREASDSDSERERFREELEFNRWLYQDEPSTAYNHYTG